MDDKDYFISVHLSVYYVRVKIMKMDHLSSKLTLIDQTCVFLSLSLSLSLSVCAITFRSTPQGLKSGPAAAKPGTAYNCMPYSSIT